MHDNKTKYSLAARITQILFSGVLGGALLISPAMAQVDEIPVIDYAAAASSSAAAIDDITAPEIMAMVYYKLAGRTPDYTSFARQSAAYKAATPLEQENVLEQEADKIRQLYTLTTLAEPIIVSKEITLSPYSFKNKGFSIEGLGIDTYFPAAFAGQKYALVIPRLQDYQWIDADEKTARDMAALLNKSKGKPRLLLHINPTYADANGTMQLDGGDYWIIAGEVKRLVLYADINGIPREIWSKTVTGTSGEDGGAEKILQLYKN